MEGDRLSVAIRKKPFAVEITKVFFETTYRPRTIRTKLENVPPNFTSLFFQPMGLWKKIRIYETQEVSETIVVSMMWCSGKQECIVSAVG
ncbi:MAG: hypothetical protein DDT18_01918 [Actinobacteria bacterium]|nr:hypothetical protein [Actinomycetota bacterium]